MRSPFNLQLVAVGLLGLLRFGEGASLTSFCITYYASTPVTPVPTGTMTATTTITRTITSTSTPKTTITPTSVTATKTITQTSKTTVSLSKTTNVYTSTSTLTATATTTSTSVAIASSTVVSTTTDTSPATATPSPDFTPLASELAAGGYSVQSSCATAVKRGARNMFGQSPNENMLVARQATGTYAAAVSCTSLMYATSTSTVVVTASTTSTKSLKQGTITSTTTVTTTSTSTKIPSTVSLTVTSTTTTTTSTAIVSSTSTSITTSVTTAYQPASTVYPACGADNIVQCVNGYQVANPHFVYNIFGIDGPTDAASCCIACSMMQNCGGSFLAAWPGQAGACYGVIADTCEGNNSFASVQIQPGNYAPYIYSNSNCGRYSVRAPDPM